MARKFIYSAAVLLAALASVDAFQAPRMSLEKYKSELAETAKKIAAPGACLAAVGGVGVGACQGLLGVCGGAGSVSFDPAGWLMDRSIEKPHSALTRSTHAYHSTPPTQQYHRQGHPGGGRVDQDDRQAPAGHRRGEHGGEPPGVPRPPLHHARPRQLHLRRHPLRGDALPEQQGARACLRAPPALGSFRSLPFGWTRSMSIYP